MKFETLDLMSVLVHKIDVFGNVYVRMSSIVSNERHLDIMTDILPHRE